MKKMGKEGTFIGTKEKPYAGPMYSPGTKEMDSKKNMGPVQGPTSPEGTIPDVLGYAPDHEDKSGGNVPNP